MSHKQCFQSVDTQLLLALLKHCGMPQQGILKASLNFEEPALAVLRVDLCVKPQELRAAMEQVVASEGRLL